VSRAGVARGDDSSGDAAAREVPSDQVIVVQKRTDPLGERVQIGEQRPVEHLDRIERSSVATQHLDGNVG
jgi:hypothetical protein